LPLHLLHHVERLPENRRALLEPEHAWDRDRGPRAEDLHAAVLELHVVLRKDGATARPDARDEPAATLLARFAPACLEEDRLVRVAGALRDLDVEHLRPRAAGQPALDPLGELALRALEVSRLKDCHATGLPRPGAVTQLATPCRGHRSVRSSRHNGEQRA